MDFISIVIIIIKIRTNHFASLWLRSHFHSWNIIRTNYNCWLWKAVDGPQNRESQSILNTGHVFNIIINGTGIIKFCTSFDTAINIAFDIAFWSHWFLRRCLLAFIMIPLERRLLSRCLHNDTNRKTNAGSTLLPNYKSQSKRCPVGIDTRTIVVIIDIIYHHHS